MSKHSDALIKELQVFIISNNFPDQILPRSESGVITQWFLKIKQSQQMSDGVPKIISFAYNNQIAELKMENCGKSLKEFMCTVKFMQLSQFHKACLAFDMLR
jgi:hypothetical protein